ncbi:universal stress protein [Streptomyces sp. C1-2]|uniref:universal stress protein n=1 Tax=Streptomyces sp. C1-2 TaxID=2720022 RepID=UPI001F112AD2|nr:universal stress protein [Streptomyces sp. C1-2]
MTLPLVVGVDGSDGSLAAVDWAVDEAARHHLELRLLYASLWERYEGSLPATSRERPSEQVMAEHIVESAAERVRRRDPTVKVFTETVAAEAVSALLDAGTDAGAVITGSRGRGGFKGTLLGSVSLAVAARAHCPVVVVRGDDTALSGAHGRVILGAGDPANGHEAVGFAFREATIRAPSSCARRSASSASSGGGEVIERQAGTTTVPARDIASSPCGAVSSRPPVVRSGPSSPPHTSRR